MTGRRELLHRAHLYLVSDERSDSFLEAAFRGGVDLVQLRMKDASDDDIVAAGKRFKRLCEEHRKLLIVNDRPDLAAVVDADGVHLGQDDMAVDRAREALGPGALIGLSTHTPEQIDAASALDIDYIGVGPVNETPTKPGRPAVGLALLEYAARNAAMPFFAIGGISAANVAAVRSAGADRVAVVRALTDSADPESDARALRAAIAPAEAMRVGAA
jgi:thiamine-phosphate pyrophosphorylase